VEKVQLQVFCFSILKRIVFLRCKAEFSVLFIQSSVSHDPSEIILIWWFDAQETFLINVEHFCNSIL